MSNTRRLVEQTWEKGAAERRDWNPQPDSAHYRVYKWWMERSGKRPDRENLCHYWQVVLIWAPLRWLVKPLLVLLGIAVVAGLIWVGVVLPIALLAILALPYVVFAGYVGKQLLHKVGFGGFDDGPVKWLDRRPDIILALAVVVTLPLLVVAVVFAFVVCAIGSIFVLLESDYKVFSRSWNWFAHARPAQPRWLTWVRPWQIIPLTLIILGVVPSGAQPIALPALVGVGGLALVVGIVLLLSYLVNTSRAALRSKRTALRYQANKRQVDEVLRLIFEVLHPAWAHDEQRYAEWRERYAEYCLKNNRKSEYDISIWSHVAMLPSRQQNKVVNILTARTTRPVREPSKIGQAVSSGFRNAGDYLELIWSVVLTKKWKICPWVELPD